MNPLHPHDPLATRDPFIGWLRVAGHKRFEEEPPPRPDITGTTVRWVTFDPEVCDTTPRCRVGLPADLHAILGEPTATQNGVLLWEIKASGS